MELVDMTDSKSVAFKSVSVRVRPLVPIHSSILSYRIAKAPDIRGFVVSGVSARFITVDTTNISYNSLQLG